MYFKNYSVLPALMASAVLLVLISVSSCTGLVKKNEQSFNSQISAENSMMKKRLPLIERENDVLKKENLQLRDAVKDLVSQVQGLGLELATLKEKYAHEIAGAAEQINSLHETIQKIENDNAEKIESLAASTKALESKLNGKIHSLKKKMTLQKTAFDQERAKMIQEHEKKQSSLTARLDSLKKTIEPKELEISSLKAAIAEISIQLGEATASSKALKKSRDEAQTELDAARKINAELIKKLDTLNHELLSQQNKQPESDH